MATDGRISSMIRDLEPDESNIFETSKPSGGSTSGYITRAVSLNGIANAVLNEMEYTTDLETDAKQVIPAVNELYTKGGKNSVLFISQELTEAQKIQARQNIGASGGSDVTMADNTKGGVDLNVGGVTRTLVNKTDITMVDNTAGGVDLNIFNKSNTLVKQSDFEDLKAEVNNKTLRFVDQQEEGMNYPPEGAIIESLLTVDGKTEQKTYTGKNLFDILDFGNHYETSGTSIVGRYPVYVGEGKQVTLSADLELISNNATVFFLPEKDAGISTNTYGVWNTQPRTITSVTGYVWVGLYFSSSNPWQVPYQDLISQGVKIQLEIGSTPTDYEPYVGGIPSPNPEYPQEIVSAHQLRFTKTGKNLYRAKSAGLESNIFNAGNLIPVRTGQRVFVNIDYTYTGTRDIFFRIFGDKGAVDKNEAIPNSTEWIRASNEVYEFVAKFDGFIGLCANSDISTYTINRCIISKVPIVAGEFPEYHEELTTITPPFSLNGINNAFDFADVDRGVWVKNIEKYFLKNYTSWLKTGSNVDRYYRAFSYLGIEVKNVKNIISSHFNLQSGGEVVGAFVTNPTSIGFAFSEKGLSTSQMFYDFVNDNDVYILYETLTPTETPINAEDLLILRFLQNLPSDNLITITDQAGRDLTYLMKYLVQRGATT